MRVDSDEYLVRYLTGDLPDEEAERLDERSIVDDEFALRLRALENDLVDSIARGEAPGVSSPYLRDKVRFAEALRSVTALPVPAAPIRSVSERLAWAGVAAVAVLAIALSGYLGFRNASLRQDIEARDADRAIVERQNMALREEVDRARPAPAPPAPTVAVLLRAPRRGLGNENTVVSIPKGTEQVTLRLQLESDAHESVWAAVREAASARILWRSPDLAAEGRGRERTVTVFVPASTFRPQLYSLDVTGLSASGSPELLAQYPFRVVLE